ncbi:ferritin family protein [Thermococcus paralvinellae]|nr:ferritin family protein [Thermococcus paralvinellae]
MEKEIDVEHILIELKNLSHEELLIYWIKNRLKEAYEYRYFAEKAKMLNKDEDIIELFIILSKDSQSNASRLWEIYKRVFDSGNSEIPEVSLNSADFKFANVSKRLEKVNSPLEVLELAMESKLLLKSIYNDLAEKTQNKESKLICKYLAAIEEENYQKLKLEYEYYKKRNERKLKFPSL